MYRFRDFSLTYLLVNIINIIFSLIVVGLILRLLLRLFGANASNAFVSFIYNSTAPLLDPFRNIFTPYVIEPGSVLEYSTLLAIIVYLIVAWLLIEFIRYITHISKPYHIVD